MDLGKLKALKAILDDLLGAGEPTDEELDYNDDAIEMYAEMHNLKESMENMGL